MKTVSKIEQYRAIMQAAAVIAVELTRQEYAKPITDAVSLAIELEMEVRVALELGEL